MWVQKKVGSIFSVPAFLWRQEISLREMTKKYTAMMGLRVFIGYYVTRGIGKLTCKKKEERDGAERRTVF